MRTGQHVIPAAWKAKAMGVLAWLYERPAVTLLAASTALALALYAASCATFNNQGHSPVQAPAIQSISPLPPQTNPCPPCPPPPKCAK